MRPFFVCGGEATASFVNIAARIAMDMPIFPRGIKCGIFGTKKVDPRLKIIIKIKRYVSHELNKERFKMTIKQTDENG